MRNYLGKLNAMCVAWGLLLYANQPVWLHDLDMVAEPFPEDEFDFSFCIFNRAVDFIKWPLLLRIDQAKDVHIGGVADDLRRFCQVPLARHCSEHFRSTSKTHRICLSSRDGCIPCMQRGEGLWLWVGGIWWGDGGDGGDVCAQCLCVH